MKLKSIFIIIMLISFIGTQTVPFEEPLSKSYNVESSFSIFQESRLNNQGLTPICIDYPNGELVCSMKIEFNSENLRTLSFTIENINNNDRIFIINDEGHFQGPFFYTNLEMLTTNPFYNQSVIIEINTSNNIDTPILKNIKINSVNKNIIHPQTKYHKKINNRSEPTIMLTGYWPPTNEMIRHFSQNENLNPNGWQGENWENRGYDIVSFFPEFSPPDCSNCGQGYGELQVDYQNTSEDFWPIVNNIEPIAMITFSRGYMDQSWEMEYNAYNRTNWYNDYSSPFQPTPNPPDTDEESFFLRNSNLPMNEIVAAIDNLNIGLTPYIDQNGDPGRFVSEFMAYHGTWYRDLNQFGDNNCIAAGHIHVGGYISTSNAILATEESIRTLIDYIDSFIYTPGDLNQDDIIDVLDLVTVVNYILNQAEFSNIQQYAADINEDSNINIQDVILLIGIILNT